MCKVRKYQIITWDNKPSRDIINEIIRVSKNQIIFGAEHLSDILPQSKGWYIWYKDKPEGTNFASCELIWTSFNIPNRFIKFTWNGMIKDKGDCNTKEKIYHPTQKPIKIIRTLISNHTKKGDIILDPYLGSGTTAIASKQLGRNFIGFEISSEYCKIANERLKQEVLFNSQQSDTAVNTGTYYEADNHNRHTQGGVVQACENETSRGSNPLPIQIKQEVLNL